MKEDEAAKNILTDRICATCLSCIAGRCYWQGHKVEPYDSCNEWKLRYNLTQEEIDQVVDKVLKSKDLKVR